jgi:ribosome-binding factor A
MNETRRSRIEELLKQEISKVIIAELADPRIGFTTVTGVKLDEDLKYANVSVSFLLPENKRSAAMEALASSAGHIRHLVMPYLKMRRPPYLRFVFDESIEKAAHISELIRKARKTDADGGVTQPDNTEPANEKLEEAAEEETDEEAEADER